jgi:hypothetical protein
MKDEEIVRKIIKRYGEVINLKTSPSTIIDIIRTFASPNGGSPPGGTPPGPTSIQGSVTNEEIMRELLKVSKQISNIKKKLGV